MYYPLMERIGFILNRHLSHLAVILLLSGCANTLQQPDNHNFAERAQKTLSAGMTQISEKYIEPVSISDLALEGLRGLDNIDPGFIVEAGPRTLTVHSNKLARREYPLPAANNAYAWSSLMVAVLQYARSNNNLVTEASEERLFEAVFDGSVSLLDTFSRYAGAKRAGENRAKRSGFGGIGVEIAHENLGARILDIFPSTPANSAGLLTNDLITHANNLPLAYLGLSKIRGILRGEIGSFVRLTVKRGGVSTFNLSLKRERILLPTVKLTRKNGILQATVTSFNNETARQLASRIHSALAEAKSSVRGMILDLRGNPGGVLTQAVMLADLFLARGKILSTHGRHPSSRQDYIARGNDILNSLPIVVLINGKSASASEIVAAALQDQKRAVIVGTASYGKGSVQSVYRLPNDGELTLTWSRFITPSGYILHNLGVPPAVCLGEIEDSPEEAIKRAMQEMTKLGDVMLSWHQVKLLDKKARANLRAICPPNTQKRSLDLRVAETLINNVEIYRRLIGLSPSIATAIN